MRLIRLKYSVTNLSVFRIVSNFTGNELNKYILGVMEGFMGFWGSWNISKDKGDRLLFVTLLYF